MDDIQGETTSSESTTGGTTRPPAPPSSGQHRQVGPESEVRGGPEADDDTLDPPHPDRR